MNTQRFFAFLKRSGWYKQTSVSMRIVLNRGYSYKYFGTTRCFGRSLLPSYRAPKSFKTNFNKNNREIGSNASVEILRSNKQIKRYIVEHYVDSIYYNLPYNRYFISNDMVAVSTKFNTQKSSYSRRQSAKIANISQM